MKKRLLILSVFCLCLVANTKLSAQVDLPFSCVSGPWQTPEISGMTSSLGADNSSTNGDTRVEAFFNKVNTYLQININGTPTALSFRMRAQNNTSTFKFVVYESDNGTDGSWSAIKTITSTIDVDDNEKVAAAAGNPQLYLAGLKSSTRFVKWVYELKGPNLYLYDVNITNATSTASPEFVSLSSGSNTTKNEITNGSEVSSNTSTSLYFKFNQTVFVKDLSLIEVKQNGIAIQVEPLYATSTGNFYYCSRVDSEIRISGIVFENEDSYSINIPASNITDILGNTLQNDIDISFAVKDTTTGIGDIIVDKVALSVTYHSLAGYEIVEPVNGIYIKKTIYTDGSVEVTKIMK